MTPILDERGQEQQISNLPPWLQWLPEAIDKYGVTAVAFGVMLYFFLGQFNGKLDAIRVTLEHHQADSARIVQFMEQQNTQNWATLAVMQRTCINTGRTQEDKLACASIINREPK